MGSRRNVDFNITLNPLDCHLVAKGGLRKSDLKSGVKLGILALKSVVSLHIQHHIQVTISALPSALMPLVWIVNVHAGIKSRRDFDLDFVLGGLSSTTVTGLALFLDDIAFAAASRASRHSSDLPNKSILNSVNLARSMASRAFFRSLAARSPGAFAGCATAISLVLDLALCSVENV